MKSADVLRTARTRSGLTQAELALPDKVVALGRALDDVPHAFGGALALAYYAEPRATQDIDVNVFVAESQAADVLSVLAPLGVEIDGAAQGASVDAAEVLRWVGRLVGDEDRRYDRVAAVLTSGR